MKSQLGVLCVFEANCSTFGFLSAVYVCRLCHWIISSNMWFKSVGSAGEGVGKRGTYYLWQYKRVQLKSVHFAWKARKAIRWGTHNWMAGCPSPPSFAGLNPFLNKWHALKQTQIWSRSLVTAKANQGGRGRKEGNRRRDLCYQLCNYIQGNAAILWKQIQSEKRQCGIVVRAGP